jgi:hypothetical protein
LAGVRPIAALPHQPVTPRLAAAKQTTAPVEEPANQNAYCKSIAFLANHAFPRLFLSKASLHAIRNGTTGASELLAHGIVTEDAYYRALAEEFGFPFVEAGEIAEVLTGAENGEIIPVDRPAVWCRLISGEVVSLMAPPFRSTAIAETRRHMARLRLRNAAITTPSALRNAIGRLYLPVLSR